eukprot:299241-Rhodomonas_salina.1
MRMTAARKKRTMSKAQEQHRADQLNPDHPQYWKSRMYLSQTDSHSFHLVNGQHIESDLDEEVTCVAVGGVSTILLYKTGDSAWTSNLPDGLYNKLTGREQTGGLPPPLYVSLGSGGRYFVLFEDGASQWVGCNDMSKCIKHTDEFPCSVAFGNSWESYFLVFEDGDWEYNNVPDDLDSLIEGEVAEDGLDIEHVSLGPNGEWYLVASDGRAWWNGLSDRMDEDILSVGNDRVAFMDFGEHYTYYLEIEAP